MAKRKKSPQDWIEEIDNALLYREKFGREGAWKQIEADYLNDPGGHTAIGPNLVYSQGDSLMSMLTVPDPEFLVQPEKRLGVEKAPIVESVSNAMVEKLKLKKHVDLSLLRGYLYGSIILKIGYDSEYGWAPYYDIGPSNNMMGLTFTQFDKKGYRIETPNVRPGWPWVRSVLPHDFVVPWGTIDIEDAPWMAHRIVRHIDHIKADVKYKNTTSLMPAISMKDYMENYLSVGAQKQHSQVRGVADSNRTPKFVAMWEIRDRLTGKIIVVTRDHNSFLREDNDAIQMACGCPFVCTTLTQHPRSFWSTPPAFYLGQIQATQFDISKQAEKQRRIDILRFLFRSNVIDEPALNKIMSGDVGACVGVDTTFPLKDLIATVPRGVNYDSVLHAENNRRDAREALGFSRNQAGEFDASSRRTAREVSAVGQGAHMRTGKRAQVIASTYINTIEKVNALWFEFWRSPREVMHDEGWPVVTGPMLKGEYQYSASLSTKRSISRAERKVEALMMLAQISPFLQGADVNALFNYLSDAVSDPAFERILAPLTGKTPQAPGGAPAGPGGVQGA